MKIDKKTLEMVSGLPDDKLWKMLSLLASASGVKLPGNAPDPKTMAGLRRAAKDLSEDDLSRAAEIFGKFKEGRRE